MSSEGADRAAEPRLHRFFTHFDPEVAAVVSILCGLVQVLLSAPLYYANVYLPRFFVLPIVIGVLIVTAGSLTMASEKFPSKSLLRGCAYSNLAGLLGALLALCFYCTSLSSVKREDCPQSDPFYPRHTYEIMPSCLQEYIKGFFTCVTVLLLVYDVGAIVLHCLLSVSALKALKNN